MDALEAKEENKKKREKLHENVSKMLFIFVKIL